MVAADPDAGDQPRAGGCLLRGPVGHGFVHHGGLQEGGAQVRQERGLCHDGSCLGHPVQVAAHGGGGGGDDAGGLSRAQGGRSAALPGGPGGQRGSAAPGLDWGSRGVVVEVVLQGGLRALPDLLVLQQHLLDPDLLQDGRQLIVVEEVNH